MTQRVKEFINKLTKKCEKCTNKSCSTCLREAERILGIEYIDKTLEEIKERRRQYCLECWDMGGGNCSKCIEEYREELKRHEQNNSIQI